MVNFYIILKISCKMIWLFLGDLEKIGQIYISSSGHTVHEERYKSSVTRSWSKK